MAEPARATLTPHYRLYTPEDRPLVLDSWCKSIRPPRPAQVRPFTAWNAEQFKAHLALLDLLLDRWPPVLAHAPAYPGQVYGWICGGRAGPVRIVHMVYTRATWRGLGVATGLVREAVGSDGPGFLTHETKLIRNRAVWAKLLKRWGLTWNPYMVAFA